MFNFFKWRAEKMKMKMKMKREVLAEASPICNCGSWPDSTWKYEDFLKKNEAIRLCPVHRHMTPIVVVKQGFEDEPSAPVTFNFDQEIRKARIHIVQAQQAVGYLSRHESMEGLELMQKMIEGIIGERKI